MFTPSLSSKPALLVKQRTCETWCMQRRTLLKLGITASAMLAVVGGTAALIRPGMQRGVLSTAGREVFRAVGIGVLDKTLAEESAAKETELEALLNRIDVLISGLPKHAQDELSQLLAILASGAGRMAFAGLSSPWAAAGAQDIQTALQNMRESSLVVRQQAYAALHDITAGAYFSEPSTWALLGYPGPLKI